MGDELTRGFRGPDAGDWPSEALRANAGVIMPVVTTVATTPMLSLVSPARVRYNRGG